MPPAAKGPWPAPLDTLAFLLTRSLEQLPAVAADLWVRGLSLVSAFAPAVLEGAGFR